MGIGLYFFMYVKFSGTLIKYLKYLKFQKLYKLVCLRLCRECIRGRDEEEFHWDFVLPNNIELSL